MNSNSFVFVSTLVYFLWCYLWVTVTEYCSQWIHRLQHCCSLATTSIPDIAFRQKKTSSLASFVLFVSPQHTNLCVSYLIAPIIPSAGGGQWAQSHQSAVTGCSHPPGWWMIIRVNSWTAQKPTCLSSRPISEGEAVPSFQHAIIGCHYGKAFIHA